MSETNNSLDMSKLTNLADAKVLYDDLRGRVEGKADKVANATNGNFAGLDAHGNLVDSGKKASDFLTEHQDISGKVDKEAGKCLSTNDYTDEEKLKNAKNASDIAALNQAMEQVDDLTKDADVTGDIVTFEDGAEDVPLKLLKIGFDPVQDLHGYDHPWPAGGGKNKWSLENTYTSASNGDWVQVDTAFVLPAGTYTISLVSSATGNTQFNFKNADGTVIASPVVGSAGYVSFTISEATATAAVCVWGDARTISNIQIESGSTATSYAPYENICPITGRMGVEVTRTGKNLFKFGVTVVDKTVDYRPNSKQRLNISEESNGDLKFAYTGGNWSIALMQIDGIDGTEDYAFSFEVASNTTSYTPRITKDVSRCTEKCLVIMISGENGSTSVSSSEYFILTKIQVEKGTTATTYEPFSGSVYPIAFPSEAGTVYGGELTVNRDGTGELVVDMVSGQITSFSGKSTSQVGNNVYYSGNVGQSIKRISDTEIPHIYSSKYLAGTYRSILNTDTKKYIGVNPYGNVNVGFGSDGLSTLEMANAYVAENPIDIVYELATPITYTLTTEQVRTLLGLNNIWTNDGDVEQLTYYLNKPINTDVQELRDSVADLTNELHQTESDIDNVLRQIGLNIENGILVIDPVTNVT